MSGMSGMLSLPTDTRAPYGFTNRQFARCQAYWQQFVTGLRGAPGRTVPRATPPVVDDDDVFALQCAEAKARMEFDEAMEAWASRD